VEALDGMPSSDIRVEEAMTQDACLRSRRVTPLVMCSALKAGAAGAGGGRLLLVRVLYRQRLALPASYSTMIRKSANSPV
jgi:hypothetical protein